MENNKNLPIIIIMKNHKNKKIVKQKNGGKSKSLEMTAKL